MDCVERSNLMLETEELAKVLRNAFAYFKRDTKDQFIHFVRYRSDLGDENGDAETEGRMKVIQ